MPPDHISKLLGVLTNIFMLFRSVQDSPHLSNFTLLSSIFPLLLHHYGWCLSDPYHVWYVISNMVILKEGISRFNILVTLRLLVRIIVGATCLSFDLLCTNFLFEAYTCFNVWVYLLQILIDWTVNLEY